MLPALKIAWCISVMGRYKRQGPDGYRVGAWVAGVRWPRRRADSLYQTRVWRMADLAENTHAK